MKSLLALLAVALLPGLALAEPAQDFPLVDLARLPDPPLLDIRYATRYNFTGEQLYPAPTAWLQRDAADALARVQKNLRAQGLGLRVFDAYRPLTVQQKMWDLIRDERYVSNPAVNQGRHTRGTAVDVGLTDLMGNPLPMPSGFDDFSEKAHADYEGASAEEQKNREILRRAMEAEGFTVYPTEWWHFDFQSWETYPVLPYTIEDLLARP
jgi:D-alanyl-D-alanine dipeptidase